MGQYTRSVVVTGSLAQEIDHHQSLETERRTKRDDIRRNKGERTHDWKEELFLVYCLLVTAFLATALDFNSLRQFNTEEDILSEGLYSIEVQKGVKKFPPSTALALRPLVREHWFFITGIDLDLSFCSVLHVCEIVGC